MHYYTYSQHLPHSSEICSNCWCPAKSCKLKQIFTDLLLVHQEVYNMPDKVHSKRFRQHLTLELYGKGIWKRPIFLWAASSLLKCPDPAQPAENKQTTSSDQHTPVLCSGIVWLIYLVLHIRCSCGVQNHSSYYENIIKGCAMSPSAVHRTI